MVGVSPPLSWECLGSPAGSVQLRGLYPSQGFGSRLCGKARGQRGGGVVGRGGPKRDGGGEAAEDGPVEAGVMVPLAFRRSLMPLGL